MLCSQLFVIMKCHSDMTFGTYGAGHALMRHIVSTTYVALTIYHA